MQRFTRRFCAAPRPGRSAALFAQWGDSCSVGPECRGFDAHWKLLERSRRTKESLPERARGKRGGSERAIDGMMTLLSDLQMLLLEGPLNMDRRCFKMFFLSLGSA